MATRMQQRRGTAIMWTNANPILGVAEIGYETDTNKFKIGDGTNRWANLSYFVDLDTMIEGAPGLLNSLDEIAAAIGDDPAFFTTLATNLATKAPLASPTFTGTVSGVTKAHVGLGNVNNTSDADKPVSTATQTALDLKANSSAITELAQDAVNSAIIAGTGLDKTYDDAANTITIDIDSTVATKTYVANAVTGATVDQSALAGVGIDWNAVTEAFDIDSTVATKSYADGKASDAQTASAADATSKANAARTAAIATAASDATTKASTAKSEAIATAASDATTKASTAKSEAIATASSDATTKAENAKSQAITAAASDATTKVSNAVTALTKSSVGLDNVDNTSDTNKPVSAATRTALDLKAPLASPVLTGNPTAPTQTVGNDSTRVATTEFVKAAIQNISSLNLVLDGGGV